MECPFCKEQINDGAVVCRFCGREHPAETERKADKRRLKIFLTIVALLIVGVVIAILSSVKVTVSSKEVAAEYKQDCITNQGYGEWRGSSGVSLDQFCELYGDAKALKESCQSNPQQC